MESNQASPGDMLEVVSFAGEMQDAITQKDGRPLRAVRFDNRRNACVCYFALESHGARV
ncbi:MAG: hypothetical protein JWP89_770 [Schlesneria sp.]|nr:hypothetical protein [Schlesneria sp.]